jgi:hypothetical protein
VTVSVARSQQVEADDRDTQLTRIARSHRPGARHWWGRRRTQTGAGAHCYICDDIIAAWSSRWPITEGARLRIALHRELHIKALLDGAATQPEE